MKFLPVTRVFAVLAICAVVILSSCGFSVESRTELLTEGTWKFQSFTNPDLDATDLAFTTAFLSLTEYDYSDDGTYVTTFADTLFDPTTGTWELNDDATVITQDKGTDDEISADIIELTKETFSYSFTDSTGLNTLTFQQ